MMRRPAHWTFREIQNHAAPWVKLVCLILVVVTFAAAVHTHQDSQLDCAKHCPCCASFHSTPATTSLGSVLVSFSVVDRVVNPRSQVASALLSYNLRIRPPPAA